jgi:hypothetical protein
MDKSSAVNQLRTILDQLVDDIREDIARKRAIEHLQKAIEWLERPGDGTTIPGEPEATAAARKGDDG